MSGLDDPRGLAFAPNGALYVTEAGSPFTPAPGTPSLPSNGASEYLSFTGSISMLQGGVQTRILSGLPSLYSPTSGDVTGPQGIGFDPAGNLYFTEGLGSDPTLRTGALSQLGLLLRVPAGTTTPSVVADISNYEALHNPAGGPIDSNPYHLVVGSTGVLVADAGGNDVLNVAFNGTISLVATLPALMSGAEAVPTALAVASNGSEYVSQLTGFPFTVGSASIFRVDGANLTTIATGFTNVIDMTFGPDGMLYVLEIDHNGLLSGNPTGGLWEVNPTTGAKTLLLTDGLVMPTSLAFDSNGILYIANQGVIPGAGDVIALHPVPEPGTWGAAGALLLAGIAAARRRWSRPTTAGTSI